MSERPNGNMTLPKAGGFFVLSLAMLGLVPLMSLLFNNGSMDFSEAAERASTATGVPWTSSLVNVIRLSLAEPMLFLTLLGSLAPVLAAIVMMLVLGDRSAWRRFGRRLLPYHEVSTPQVATTYLLILLLLVPCLFLTFEIRQLLGADYEREIAIGPGLVIAILVIALLDQGAVLEELGWRGYLAPEMQDSGISPLNTALIVGLIWGLWHLPRDITTGVITRLGYIEYATMFLPSFVLGTISVSVIAAWFMNRTGGSVIPAILIHGLTNDSIGISGAATINEALTPFHQITKNLPFALIATGLVLVSGAHLGRTYKGDGPK